MLPWKIHPRVIILIASPDLGLLIGEWRIQSSDWTGLKWINCLIIWSGNTAQDTAHRWTISQTRTELKCSLFTNNPFRREHTKTVHWINDDRVCCWRQCKEGLTRIWRPHTPENPVILLVNISWPDGENDMVCMELKWMTVTIGSFSRCNEPNE